MAIQVKINYNLKIKFSLVVFHMCKSYIQLMVNALDSAAGDIYIMAENSIECDRL